jgi:predicted nucleotidyltransferase component of viral defense system
MTKRKRRHIDPATARRMSDLGHMAFIEALTNATPLQAKQFAFHGGTSLHLSWKSPRFSEDLDFLLDRKLEPKMGRFMRKIETRMKAFLRAEAPDLDLDVRIDDKTREGSNLLNYRITVSSPLIVGNVKVKAEFWQVESEYLRHYDTRFAYPLKGGDVVSSVSQPMPAASLEAAYADKLTAFATRRHLKWRDVFDLWWLGQKLEVEPAAMADRFLHHVTAFDTVNGLPPAAALWNFLERSPEEITKEADPDLRKWLPASLWESLAGNGIEEIVAEVRAAIKAVATELDSRQENTQENEEHHVEETPDLGL